MGAAALSADRTSPRNLAGGILARPPSEAELKPLARRDALEQNDIRPRSFRSKFLDSAVLGAGFILLHRLHRGELVTATRLSARLPSTAFGSAPATKKRP